MSEMLFHFSLLADQYSLNDLNPHPERVIKILSDLIEELLGGMPHEGHFWRSVDAISFDYDELDREQQDLFHSGAYLLIGYTSKNTQPITKFVDEEEFDELYNDRIVEFMTKWNEVKKSSLCDKCGRGFAQYYPEFKAKLCYQTCPSALGCYQLIADSIRDFLKTTKETFKPTPLDVKACTWKSENLTQYYACCGKVDAMLLPAKTPSLINTLANFHLKGEDL